MSTATYPLRTPHRGVTTRLPRWLIVLVVSLGGSALCTAPLHGQELDYRFIDLAGYMDAWPNEEAETLPLSLLLVQPPAVTPYATETTPTEAAPAGPAPREPAQAESIQTESTQTASSPSWHHQPRFVGPTQTGATPLGPTEPNPPQATLVTSKWRTNLTEPRVGQLPAKPSRLPGPVLEEPDGNIEVLVVPNTSPELPNLEKQPVENRTPAAAKQQPAAKPRDCYQPPPLSALTVSIGLPAGKLPSNAAAETAPTGDTRLAGAWAVTEHHWSATCLRHRPLYFEEINAERYGYTVSHALQPIISAARFFATIPALPYKMAIDHPRDCIYTLGHYRPGSCVPRRWHHLPWKLSAGVVEVGFIAGMILLIP